MGVFGGSTGEDEGGTEDGGARIARAGDEENASARDGGRAAAISIDEDVLGLAARGEGHDGVGEFVEMGVEVFEREDEVARDGDCPERDAEGGGGEEEFLGFGQEVDCIY